MKSKMTLILAASAFTLALAANPHSALAAKKSPPPPPPPPPTRIYPLPKFNF
jgi:hypothetical protein